MSHSPDSGHAGASDPVPASGSRRVVLRLVPGIAAVALSGLILAGCGGDDEGDDDEDDDD